MARRKKKSAILEKSQERLTGLKTIDGKADLGNGITSVTFEKEVSGLRQQIEAYNVGVVQNWVTLSVRTGSSVMQWRNPLEAMAMPAGSDGEFPG